MTDSATQAVVPLVRVERGVPTPEEIAAIAVVMLVAAGGRVEVGVPARRRWSHRSRTFNPGAVRGSGWGVGF